VFIRSFVEIREESMSKQRSERGQVLILIILAIVALFGFAALAVDIGRLYAERRRMQSAADSAVLAAAFAASQTPAGDYVVAALDQFHANGYDDTDANANPTARVDVQVYNPPISGPYGPDSEYDPEDLANYYQVIVRAKVDPVFAQFVYTGDLEATVESVARYSGSHGFYEGDVLHATNKERCKALWFSGTAATTLTGGNVYSDSNAGASRCSAGEGPTSPASCDSGVQGGSGEVIVENGTIYTTGNWGTNGGAATVVVADPIEQCVDPNPPETIPEPDCSDPDMPLRYYADPPHGEDTVVLEPGRYPEGIQVSKNDVIVNMNKGMYCLDDSLRMNGGVITGYGIMIVMLNGEVALTGNTIVNLTAANKFTIDPLSNDEINKYQGMLLYMPFENTNRIILGGTSGSEYTGTIYAPGPAPANNQDKCTFIGTGNSLGLSSNVICDTITISGNAAINITYDAANNYHLPASMDLVQ
jgi:hypothetical protein